MKYLIKISMAFLAVTAVLSSCQQKEPSLGFGISTREITIGAEGGTDIVRVESDSKWIATTEVPWITVSPANGRGNVDCNIKIDTTLYADRVREATVRFFSSERGEELRLRVIQTGFEKMITLSETNVDLPSYGAFGKRSFEVELTSNVEFTVSIPDSVKWLTYDNFHFDMDRGSRPRTVKLHFKWDNNTRPWDRLACVSFVPTNSESLARNDELRVVLTKAAKIEDNREGDSLAIIACMRSLNIDLGRNEGENMANWTFVTLWEPTDEDITPDKVGRVRSVLFYMSSTYDGIPYEIQFLTKAEEVRFYSNTNAFLKNLSTGDYLSELTQLKRLQIFAFGLNRIDQSLAGLSNLEVIDLSGNNFNEVSDVLTPENFPKLRHLDLGTNRRWIIFDMQTTTYEEDVWGGFRGTFPEQLLRWDSLEYLGLSYNYIYGPVPDMSGYEKTYTQEDCDRDTLPALMLGTPKVLPVIKVLRINLNLLDGEIPHWILYHPHLMEWDPMTLVFNQDYSMFNKDGNRPGFTNIPEKPDYYYDAYPHKRP